MGKKSQKNSDKGGRPRIYEGETQMRSLRFPVKDWEQWAAFADANGGSVTGLIVRAVNEHIERARKGRR